MNGVRARDERGTNDVRNVELAFATCPWPDADMFIGHTYREGVTVGL
ncbi:MAG: hypothetical protein NVSMB27_10110 [Ktedonobacteraceae bacterium]